MQAEEQAPEEGGRHAPAVNEVAAALLGDVSRKDGAFAAGLKRNPKEALEDASGTRFVPEFKVHTVQNTADEVHVPLPAYSGMDELKYRTMLSDKELADIAGGELFMAMCGAIALAVGTSSMAIAASITVGGIVLVGIGIAAAVGTATALGRMASKRTYHGDVARAAPRTIGSVTVS